MLNSAALVGLVPPIAAHYEKTIAYSWHLAAIFFVQEIAGYVLANDRNTKTG